MTTLKSTQDGGVFISNPIEQGFEESEWTSYKPSFKGRGTPFNIGDGTTNTELVVIDNGTNLLPVTGEPVIAKDGTDTGVVRGNLGTVTINTTIPPLDQAEYNDVSFSLGSFAPSARDLFFNNDGTKLYVISSNSETVYQFTTPAPFALEVDNAGNIITPTLDTSFPVPLQDAIPISAMFNNDGSKLYVLGTPDSTITGKDVIYEYDLSTLFDLATALYNSVFFDITSLVASPVSFDFNNNGTKIYICSIDDIIYQYSLSTAFDIASATYDSISYDIDAAVNFIQAIDIKFNNDGTKLFIVSSQNEIYSLSLSTPYDITTISYNNVLVDISVLITSVFEDYPRGIAFSNDGSKFFITGERQLAVYEFTLSETKYIADISPLNLVSPPSIITQDNLPRFFSSFESSAGRCISQNTVLPYVSSTTTEYTSSLDDFVSTLQTGDTVIPFDGAFPDPISGATYDDVSFSYVVEYNLEGMEFSNDGLKLFVTGTGKDRIHQYSLTTAFDVTTALYDQISFPFLSGLTTDPISVVFNNNGTKMYILAISGDVFQYTLGTPFDLSGIVAADSLKTISLGTLDGTPRAITFNNDGSKIYMLGGASNAVYEVPLTTPFDISTGITSGAPVFNVGTQDNEVEDVVFSSDGTKMFMIGSSSDSIHQYTLSIAYDIATASYDSVSLSVSIQDNFPVAIDFSSDGTKLGLLGRSNGDMYHYTLSSAYDISTAVFDGLGPNLYGSISKESIYPFSGAQINNPQGGIWKPDGTKFYLMNTTSADILQYSVSTPFDISTMSTNFEAIYSTYDVDTYPYNFEFNSDGTKFFLFGGDVYNIYQFSMSVAYDFTNGNGTPGIFLDVATQANYVPGYVFNNNGTKIYLIDIDDGSFLEYDLAIAYDVSSATYNGVSFAYRAGQTSSGSGIAISSDGTRLYLTDLSTAFVYQYSFGTPYDLSTLSTEYTFDSTGQDFSPYGIEFNDTGTKAYVGGTDNNQIYQYSLTSAFDLSTATYDAVSFNFSPRFLYDFRFSSDGTRLYLVEASGFVYQYSLTTPFDVSTVVDNGVSFDASSQDTSLLALQFNPTGTSMYLTGFDDTSVIYQYVLSTPFDVSSAEYRPNATVSYDNVSFDPTAQGSFGNKVFFNDTGSKMYYFGPNDFVYQYSLPTPFDISEVNYDNKSFDLGTAETSSPYDIHFNANGTKLFVLSTFSPLGILQYTLSTPYDVSTLSYDNVLYTFPSLVTSVTYFTWNNAGTKFYIGEDSNGPELLQFSVNGSIDGEEFVEGSAISLTSGASITVTDTSIAGYAYNNESFDVSTQEISPLGITFNDTGTKMYVVGSDSDSIYEYTLTTAFDVSTASYNNVSFSIAAQETQPYSLTFNDNGLLLYTTGPDSGTVHQYQIAVPYDISTIAYNDQNFAIAEDTTPYDVAFNNDGTRMYVAGGETNAVYQYTLSTAFDVASAGYSGSNFSFFNSQGDSPINIQFSNNGEKMYVLGLTTELIYQYTLSTPFDISTASYDDKSFDGTSEDTSPRGFVLNNDATKLFMIGVDTDSVYQYSLVEDAYTVGFSPLAYAPGKLVIPDRSIEHTSLTENTWVEDYVQTAYSIIDESGRAVQYKFLMDTNVEATEVRYDLTKVLPGIRDTRDLTP